MNNVQAVTESKRCALSALSVRVAETHLAQSCKVMARLVSAHGHCPLATRKRHPFQTLVASIISQQLSARAADTIKRRVVSLVPSFSPEGFRAAPVSSLRTAGLSAAKVRYIVELANRVSDGRLNLNALMHQSDADVITALTELPGIGRWTVEMFLIFGLKRPDVLPLDDAGLQRSVRLLYGDATDLEQIGNKWRPYCSVASWYLWRSLDVA